MKQLIVNADDFGVAESVNRGIIYGHKNGIITSTSLMINRPYAEEAAQLAKENPKLGVGLHFEIIGDDNQILRGMEKVLAYIALGTFQAEKVTKQFFDQIEIFKKLIGKLPDHIDGHYHVHKLPVVFPTIKKFCQKYQIPFRMMNKVNFIDSFSTNKFKDASKENLIKILKTLPDGIFELMTHSGFTSEELRQTSSMSDIREKELNILTSPGIKKVIKEEKIKLISWKNVLMI